MGFLFLPEKINTEGVSEKYELWLENSEYLGSLLDVEKKKNGYSETEESTIFAGADPSVDQGTEKSHCSQ